MKHSTTVTETARHSFARREYLATCVCGWNCPGTSKSDVAYDAKAHRNFPHFKRAGEFFAAPVAAEGTVA